MWTNKAIQGHPLVGTTQAFRPNMAPVPVAANYDRDSQLVVAVGMQVIVRDVFHDWNGIPGLTMFYVDVPDTGYRTHLSERELGMVYAPNMDGRC